MLTPYWLGCPRANKRSLWKLAAVITFSCIVGPDGCTKTCNQCIEKAAIECAKLAQENVRISSIDLLIDPQNRTLEIESEM